MGGTDTGTGSSDNDFTTGSGGALFGNPTGGSFHIHDYDVWDWKHIEAAILGMGGGVSDDANLDQARSVADPQSLQDAADAFYHVQQVFSGVSQALADQSGALAGKDGVWKGDAADAFTDMIKLFSKQVGAVADVISGGESGGNSVPQQLADNAVSLVNAQNKIAAIDNWYAEQAHLMGADPMSSGLIPVSQKPEVVAMMNHDMREVLKSLASEYQVTVDTITSPGPVNSPFGGGTGLNLPNPTDQPPLNATDGLGLGPNPKPFPTKVDSLGPNPGAGKNGPDGTAFKTAVTPFGGGTGTEGAGTLGTPAPLPTDLTSGAELAGGAFPAGTDLDGLGAGLAGLGALRAGSARLPGGLDSFPDSTGVGGTGTLGGLSPLPKFDSGTGTGTGGAAAPLPGAFPGSTGIGGTGTLGGLSPLPTSGSGTLGSSAPLPGAFPGSTGVGGTGSLGIGDSLGTADPGTWSSKRVPGAFPGALGTSGTGSLGSGVSGGKPVAFPGDLSASSGLPGGLSSAPSVGGLPGIGEAGAAFPGSLSTDGQAGMGMPFLPGTGGGAPTSQTSHEPSDASGLLDHDAQPWTGTTDVGDDMDTHLGTATGGEGLTLPTDTTTAHDTTTPGSAGMPFLPNTGSGAPTSQTSHEPSDASGLLDHDAQPWTGTTDVGDDMDTHLGTATGGEGLTLPTDTTTAHDTTTPGSAGMPFLPNTGSGAPTSQTSHEPSDASGLLEQSNEPWAGEAGGEMAEAGTAAGGEGLALPFVPLLAAPEREHAEQRATAAAALSVEEAATVWAEGTAEAEPAPVSLSGPGADTDSAVEAAVPAEEGRASEQASAGIPVPATAGDDGPETAWDVAGAAFAPLLWAASAEEEADVTAEGPATADEGSWGVAAAEPSFTTWQRNRTGEAAATPAAAALAGAALSCSTDDIASEPEPEPAEAADEETPVRGAADLLVQDRDLWGTADAEGLGAII